MTIKDKLLSGGYTLAETFVCHVKKVGYIIFRIRNDSSRMFIKLLNLLKYIKEFNNFIF